MNIEVAHKYLCDKIIKLVRTTRQDNSGTLVRIVVHNIFINFGESFYGSETQVTDLVWDTFKFLINIKKIDYQNCRWVLVDDDGIDEYPTLREGYYEG